jgi:hypothetical protein
LAFSSAILQESPRARKRRGEAIEVMPFSMMGLVVAVGVPKEADPRVGARVVADKEVEASRGAEAGHGAAAGDHHDRDLCEQSNYSLTILRRGHPSPRLALNEVEYLMLPSRTLKTIKMTTDSNWYNIRPVSSPLLYFCF